MNLSRFLDGRDSYGAGDVIDYILGEPGTSAVGVIGETEGDEPEGEVMACAQAKRMRPHTTTTLTRATKTAALPMSLARLAR